MTELDLTKRRGVLSRHPVEVGQRTEAVILAELVKRGYRVLLPFGVNQRYDLVVDVNGEFVRAQCKTGRLRSGVVKFSTRSVQTNSHRTIGRNYAGDADLFLVHCPDTGRIYAVPVDEAPGAELALRVDPTLNNQARRIRWARDYELPG